MVKKYGKEAVTIKDHPKKDEIKNVIAKNKHFRTTYKGITVHNNGNPKSTAYGDISYAINHSVSWHYSCDDKESLRFIPYGYSCWACGDGSKGFGNAKTINIEINEHGGYANINDARWIKARSNAIHLIAQLCVDHKWGTDVIGQHHDRSGKNCPRILRKGNEWEKFINEINEEITNIKLTK